MNRRGRILKDVVLILLCITVFIAIAAQNVWARRYFFIERPKLGLNLSYEFETEKRTGQDIDTDNTFQEFREGFDIQTKGWVYHPALLTFRVGLQPRLTQTIEGDTDGSPFLQGYSLDASFLPAKPYTLHVFGRRYEDSLRSAFAARSDTEVDTYGANLMLKYSVLPTTLSYVHRSSEQTGFFDSDEDTDDFRISSRHKKAKSDTKLLANYKETERKISGTTTRTKSSNGFINNNYNITGDRRLVLDSFLSYRWTETGSIDTSDSLLSERLHWQHRENLKSDYNFKYENNKSDDFKKETTSFDAQLTHLLYENLTTNVAGRGSLSDFTGGKEKIYGGNLDFFYQRKIPWGALNLNAGWNYTVTEREVDTKDIQVIDEPHVLTIGEVTLLDNQNVDINSIVVTDITSSIVYVENVDYDIFPRDSFVQIRRIPGGGIADGQTILVSYKYFTTSFDDALFRQSYGISFGLWSALELFYQFSHAKQDILSGTSLNETIDDTIHTAGMRLYWRWTETILDYEDTNVTTGISTETWRAEEILTFRPVRKLFIKFSGYYGERRFQDIGNTEKFYGWATNIDWLITRWCKLGGESYQHTVSGKSEKTVDTRASTILEFSYGIWRGSIRYEFIDENDEVSDQRRTNHHVLVEFIRILW
jgi:hypothetical protein